MDPMLLLRATLALALVLALIAATAVIARRLGLAGRVDPGGTRLAVVASRALDARRRLVLVRRDGVEHLLLLGPAETLLVERAIPGRGRAAGEAPPA